MSLLRRKKMVALAVLLLVAVSTIFLVLPVWTGAGDSHHKHHVIQRFRLWPDDGSSTYFPLVFCPNKGGLLAAGDFDGNVSLWEPVSGENVMTFAETLESSPESLAFSRDGSRLVAANSYGEVITWDVNHGTLVSRFSIAHQPAVITQYEGGTSIDLPCSGVVISPNAAKVAYWDPNKKAVSVWNVAEEREERVWQVGIAWLPAVFSSDGKFLILADPFGTLAIWDLKQEKPAAPFGSNGGDVWSACLSSDDKTLATGGWDGLVKLWHLEKGTKLRTLRADSEPIRFLAFTADGKTLAAGIDRRADPWWTSYIGNSQLFTRHVGRVSVWDVATGKQLDVVDKRAASVVSLSYSPDGRDLAIGCWDGTVTLTRLAAED